MFESIVEKVIIGESDENGNANPYKLTFVYKTGYSNTVQSKMHKQVKNMYNCRKRHPAVPIEEAAFCAAGEKLERTDDLDSLAKAVLKLPAIYKDALKLKYVQEFSNAEIAGMLGISETAVRKRLERARRMLEEILRREDFCDED